VKRRQNRRGFTLIELMIVIAIIAILAAVLIPNFVRARSMAQLAGCKSNLKNIATALEAYSVDHNGHYPSALTQITPNYIRAVPDCPAASSDTYSGAYTVAFLPDSFEVFCEGTVHQALAVTVDYPRWDSGRGLIER
jgi:type IV pilus assembly protein PilA